MVAVTPCMLSALNERARGMREMNKFLDGKSGRRGDYVIRRCPLLWQPLKHRARAIVAIIHSQAEQAEQRLRWILDLRLTPAPGQTVK